MRRVVSVLILGMSLTMTTPQPPISNAADAQRALTDAEASLRGAETATAVARGLIERLKAWFAAQNTGGATPTQQTYQVVRGDTLSAIATRFGATVEQLQLWNNLGTSTTIYIGQTLKVKAPATPTPNPTPNPNPNPNPPPTPTPPPSGSQTLGVGGVATPSGAVVESGNKGAWTITSGGSQGAPKVYDGKGFTSGRITVKADWVVVQNYNVRSGSQYGIVVDADNVTIQNNDIKDVRKSGDGDLNAITAWGNGIKILYNTAIDFVGGDPGGSHTDFIQSWVSDSHPTASSDWVIWGNKAVGPNNPSRSNSIPSIHQWLMVEDYGRGGNSGGSSSGMKRWLIGANIIGDSWNQAIKLDGVDEVSITKNEFIGSSSKVMEVTSASSGVKFFSDNKVTGKYGSVGYNITAGAGPNFP